MHSVQSSVLPLENPAALFLRMAQTYSRRTPKGWVMWVVGNVLNRYTASCNKNLPARGMILQVNSIQITDLPLPVQSLPTMLMIISIIPLLSCHIPTDLI